MTDTDVEKLVQKRALKRFKTFINNLDNIKPDLVQLELRLNKLNLCWQSFDDIQSETEAIDMSQGHEIEVN